MTRLDPMVVVLASILLPGAARADEREWVLGLEPGFGFFDAGSNPTQVGAGGHLSLWLGLTDAAWLFVSGGIEASLAEGPTIGEGVFGAVAALDVLRAIPFLEIGAGLDRVGDHTDPVLRLGAGLDYLLTPEIGVGAVVRYRPLFGAEGESWVTAHLRLSYRGEL